MERVKKQTPTVEDNQVTDDRIRWRKDGGGSARLTIAGKKRIIKPGEKFWATVDEIPKGMRDVIIPIGGLPEVKKVEIAPVKKIEFKVVPRGNSKSMFDVIGPNGKLFNDKSAPLTKEKAESMKKDLER